MIFVKDLTVYKHVDEITLTIVAKEPARYVKCAKFTGLRCVAIGRDETGEIKVTLYDQEAYEVELGDRIKITNGYCGSWQGDRVLSTGASGRVSITSVIDSPNEINIEEDPTLNQVT